MHDLLNVAGIHYGLAINFLAAAVESLVYHRRCIHRWIYRGTFRRIHRNVLHISILIANLAKRLEHGQKSSWPGRRWVRLSSHRFGRWFCFRPPWISSLIMFHIQSLFWLFRRRRRRAPQIKSRKLLRKTSSSPRHDIFFRRRCREKTLKSEKEFFFPFFPRFNFQVLSG